MSVFCVCVWRFGVSFTYVIESIDYWLFAYCQPTYICLWLGRMCNHFTRMYKGKTSYIKYFAFYWANLYLSIGPNLNCNYNFYCSNIKFINNASNTYISGFCHINYAVEQGKLFSVLWRLKRYFEIDQHLAWHLGYYV